ncbi:nitrate reductase [Nevskia soli]|uniref:nitrate reductase n=1 Tax=Nevskia soli TaxID=418856 RepID=UPI0004A6E436|nr:nitrate reductase [Nevskia soli]
MTMTEPVPAIRTTCPYCGVGCGVLATSRADGSATIAGDPAHPANFGRLCSKGSALGETVSLHGRLLHPHIRSRIGGRDAAFRDEQVSWDEALDYVAEKFGRIIERHGPDSVALYVSGQLLTEDYYVANKLVKGWWGTANIDTNSRLCMSSAVAGYKRAFGEDVVPCSYEDLETADLIVLVGSNTAWCHPVVYQRIVAARERRPDLKLVVIDPRRTPTCDIADLHLPLRSGSDVALFNGLLAYLSAQGKADQDFIAAHTQGLDAALRAAIDGGDVAAVALACGIEAGLLGEFYALFAATARTVTMFSMGVNQSGSGTDKVNSIINCHLYTGRVGKPGAGPFSITGQPNAMGGREVGGLANMLAAHMDLDNAQHRDRVRAFWNSPRIADKPGLKAVDLFEAIGQGKVKAVWIMATNPLVSLPDADRVREALQRCELVVVSDCVADTDTAKLAHVLLPAAAWGEKTGTVTNSERCVSRQRAFLPLPGEARPDWWAICEMAKRLGYAEGFNFRSAHEIFLEHARLSAYENDATQGDARVFNLSGLENLSDLEYDELKPVRWPLAPERQVSGELFPKMRFTTPDGRARFVPTVPRLPAHAPDEKYPLVLNTGRIRDQWHTMTRTGRAPRLTAHRPEPFVEVHPQDLLTYGLRDGELARISTHWGAAVARVNSSREQRRGNLFLPIHWSDAFAADARTGALVNPVVDPVSGEPEFKHTPAQIEPFSVDWYGFLLVRRPVEITDLAYWARSSGTQFQRYEFAGRGRDRDWSAWVRARLAGAGEWLDYADASAGAYRAARIDNGRLEACVFVSPRPDLPEREWLGALFAKECLGAGERGSLLAGRPSLDGDTGPTVCACFGVGRRTLQRAIREHGCTTPKQLGQRLKAGTNCGSCVPELRRLIEESLVPAE